MSVTTMDSVDNDDGNELHRGGFFPVKASWPSVKYDTTLGRTKLKSMATWFAEAVVVPTGDTSTRSKNCSTESVTLDGEQFCNLLVIVVLHIAALCH